MTSHTLSHLTYMYGWKILFRYKWYTFNIIYTMFYHHIYSELLISLKYGTKNVAPNSLISKTWSVLHEKGMCELWTRTSDQPVQSDQSLSFGLYDLWIMGHLKLENWRLWPVCIAVLMWIFIVWTQIKVPSTQHQSYFSSKPMLQHLTGMPPEQFKEMLKHMGISK